MNLSKIARQTGLAAAVGLGVAWAMPDANDSCLHAKGVDFCPTGTVTVFSDKQGIVFDALKKQNPLDLRNEGVRKELIRAAAGHLDLDTASADRLQLLPDIGQDGRFVLAGLESRELSVFPAYDGDDGIADENSEQFLGGFGGAYAALAAFALGAKGEKRKKRTFNPKLEGQAQKLSAKLGKKAEWEELRNAPPLAGYRSPPPRRSISSGFGNIKIIGGTEADNRKFSNLDEVDNIAKEGRQRARAAAEKTRNRDDDELRGELMANVPYEGKEIEKRSKGHRSWIRRIFIEAKADITDTRPTLARELDRDGIPNALRGSDTLPPFIKQQSRGKNKEV